VTRLFMAALCAFALVAMPAGAQQATTPKEWSEHLMQLLVNQGPDRAFAALNEESFLGQHVKTVAPVLRDSAQKAVTTFGTMIGFELVRETPLGSRVTRLTYLVHHVHMASQYRFFFYRTERGWNLVGIQWEGEAVKFDF
jgi:hypothetical protein